MGTINVEKRDGKQEPFSIEKIKVAMKKAFLSVGSMEPSEEDIIEILETIIIEYEKLQNQLKEFFFCGALRSIHRDNKKGSEKKFKKKFVGNNEFPYLNSNPFEIHKDKYPKPQRRRRTHNYDKQLLLEYLDRAVGIGLIVEIEKGVEYELCRNGEFNYTSLDFFLDKLGDKLGLQRCKWKFFAEMFPSRGKKLGECLKTRKKNSLEDTQGNKKITITGKSEILKILQVKME